MRHTIQPSEPSYPPKKPSQPMEPFLWLLVVLFILSNFLPKKRQKRKARKRTKERVSEPALTTRAGRKNGPCLTSDDDAPKKETIVRRELMGFEQRQFFEKLSKALPNHYISSQVSFNALVTHSPHVWGNFVNNVRRQFHHKYVDFVVCEKESLEVVAIVEYDGSGHRADHDEFRDEMLRRAGYQSFRFDGRATVEAIQQAFGSGELYFPPDFSQPGVQF